MIRWSVILFSAFYLSVSLGLSLNVHYCMGEIDSVQLMADGHECCCGFWEMPPGCCDDKEVDLSLDTDQHLSQLSPLSSPSEWSVLNPAWRFSELFHQDDLTDLSLPGRPPPDCPPKDDLRILFRSLTFYG